jgi:hypothetical protein
MEEIYPYRCNMLKMWLLHIQVKGIHSIYGCPALGLRQEADRKLHFYGI